jgi:hypothetical protein
VKAKVNIDQYLIDETGRSGSLGPFEVLG